MFNFMCQFTWAVGHPDICSNIILSASVRMFLDEINMWLGRSSKADCPPKRQWASFNQMKVRIEQKG